MVEATLRSMSYSVTITADHRLVVNDDEVAPPETAQPGDSESLLSWALDQVCDAHREHGGRLHLTIRDQRDAGYGTRRVRLRDGQQVTIDDLRAHTKHDYRDTSIQPDGQTAQSAYANDIATAPPEDDAIAPDQRHSAGTPDSSPDRDVAACADDEDWPAHPARDEPGTAAPLPHRQRSTVQAARVDPTTTPKKGRSTKPGRVDHAQRNGNERPAERRPSTWRLTTRRVPRPVATRTERGAKSTSPKRRRVRIVSLVVVAAVLAGLVGVRIVGGGPTTYVAVCVDNRKMSRLPTDSNCKDGGSAYYRWWYVPEGARVPAVQESVEPGDGAFTSPSEDDATIDYGFASEGGSVRE